MNSCLKWNMIRLPAGYRLLMLKSLKIKIIIKLLMDKKSTKQQQS